VRGLAAAVLTFEAIVIGLAIPVAVAVAELDPSVAVPAGLGLALLCLVTAGLLRRPLGYRLGWAIQVAAVALGFVIPAMFFLGGLFAFLWFMALRLGGEVEAARARRAAQEPPD
jgi:hypothetical protein